MVTEQHHKGLYNIYREHMNILIIHSGYPLNNASGEVVRTKNMAKSLASFGHKVTVLLLYNVKCFRPKNAKLITHENNIRYIKIPTFPTSKLLKFGAIYNKMMVWLVVQLIQPKVIQAEITWSASITSFVKRKKLVTDFHSDLVPEVESLGGSKVFIDKLKQDNIYALTNSDYILCVSNKLHDNLFKTYGFSFPSNILPCNVDFGLFAKERLLGREKIKQVLGLDGKIILAYLGGTHQWQCLNETLDIFKRLRLLDNKYYFCLFTNGSLKPFAAQIESIKDVFLTMELNTNNIVEYLSIVDAGFVIRDNLLLNANSSPTKTGEYMAAGAMAIATKYSGDAPELISESQFGYILNSINPTDREIRELNEKIQDFVSDVELNRVKVREYIEYSRSWNRNKEKLNKIYCELETV